MSAGKGPQIRKGADLNLYWQNYDQIFRKEEEPDESKESLCFSELKKIETKCCGGHCYEKKDT
jgi:hypothetical protein